MPRRDGYSNFSFLSALVPRAFALGAAYTGVSIDMRGYDTCTFVVNVGTTATSTNTWGGADYWNAMLDLGWSNAAGAVQWSEANSYVSLILHSVYGEAGAYSVMASAKWMSWDSIDYLSTTCAIGIKNTGKFRWARLRLSETGACSNCGFGATAILGKGGTWPVNTPISL